MHKTLLRAIVAISTTLTLTCVAATPALAATGPVSLRADNPRHHGGGITVGQQHAVRAPSLLLRASALPASVDLTQWAPAVGDQGSNGACVSWAIAHTLMGWYANKARVTQTFAPMYLYSQVHSDNSADGGGSSSQAAYAIASNQGVAPEGVYTQGDYDFKDLPTAAETAAASPYRITKMNELFSSGDAESGIGSAAQNTIEQALAAGNPVGLGLPVYDAFQELSASHSTLHLTDSGATSNYEGGHYLIALGYDSEGVTVENSWGTSWGKSGYAKLGWDFVAAKVFEAEDINGVTGLTGTNVTPVQANTLASSPVNLHAKAGHTSIALAWTPPTSLGSPGATTYLVTVTGAGTTRTYTVPLSATTYTVNGLKAHTSYRVSVAVVNTAGTGATATATAITTVYNPGLHGVKGTLYPTKSTWTWHAASANDGYISGYAILVYRGDKRIQKQIYGAGTRHATISHLHAHTTYHFIFVAINSYGGYTAKGFTGRSN